MRYKVLESSKKDQKKNLRPRRKKKRRQKVGRKPQRKEFKDTRLGRLLQFHTPLEFALIVDSCNGGTEPKADLIEQIGYVSTNPFFKTPRFRFALIDYRKHGVYGLRIRPHSEEKKQNLMKKFYRSITA